MMIQVMNFVKQVNEYDTIVSARTSSFVSIQID